ncbi:MULTISPECIES: hypothetical protein [unclassified Mesorhizobium]|uniref:hypothetical protein n=1 Tax=unclassified Mesorhizobium TaxID=325217 RepID=UPI00167285CE|nr:MULTISPECIES: hypothetical protein [unclassified Mesorhizobium]
MASSASAIPLVVAIKTTLKAKTRSDFGKRMIISRDVASGQHCSHYAFWPLPAPIDRKAIAGNSDILAGFDPNFQVFQPCGLSQQQKIQRW